MAFPDTLDPPAQVGNAVAAVERRIGVTNSTDVSSVTGALSRIVPQLPHRSGGSAFVHSATGAAAGSNVLSVGLVYAIPMFIPATAVYSSCGVIRTASVVGGTERLGVYSDGGGYPLSLLADWGNTVVASATGQIGFKQITPGTSTSLSAGWVWLACCPQGAANTIFSTVGTSTGAPVVLGTTVPSASGMTMGYSGPSTTGQLPASWGGTFTECAVVPLVYVARA